MSSGTLVSSRRGVTRTCGRTGVTERRVQRAVRNAPPRYASGSPRVPYRTRRASQRTASCGESSASTTVSAAASIRSSACARRTGVLRKYREVVVMFACPRKSRTSCRSAERPSSRCLTTLSTTRTVSLTVPPASLIVSTDGGVLLHGLRERSEHGHEVLRELLGCPPSPNRPCRSDAQPREASRRGFACVRGIAGGRRGVGADTGDF